MLLKFTVIVGLGLACLPQVTEALKRGLRTTAEQIYLRGCS